MSQPFIPQSKILTLERYTGFETREIHFLDLIFIGRVTLGKSLTLRSLVLSSVKKKKKKSLVLVPVSWIVGRIK